VCAAAAPRDVLLLPSGAGSAHFSVTVPAATIETVPGSDGGSEIRITGYGNAAPPGSPALPVRLLQVAVPPSGEVRLSASGVVAETRSGVLLAPLGLLPRGLENEPPRFERSAAVYAATAPLAPQRARLVGVSWMRDQRVATVAVFPADYEAGARRVTLYRQIEVELTFGPGAGAAPPSRSADPFEAVYREALVNYEAGKAWRRPQAAAGTMTPLLGAGPALPGASPALAVPVPDTSVFVGRDWIKIAITKTGFYKVEFGQVRNTPLFTALPGGADSAPMDSLRLFTWPGNPVLPEDTYCDSCEFREVAIQVEEPETTPAPNGKFDRNADNFTFFALGPSDWADLYDPTLPESVFVNHPYETRNYYYLTVATADQPVARGAPARIQSVTTAATGPTSTPADFAARVHVEQDIEYLPDLAPNYYGPDPGVFWEKWFWRTMSIGGQFSPDVDTPGADSLQLATVRIRQWGIDWGGTCSGDEQHFLEVFVNNQPLGREGWNSKRPFAYIADVPIGALRGLDPNTIRVSIPTVAGCGGRADRSALAWIEVRYRRKFVPEGNELEFDSPAGGGDYLYDIGPFTSSVAPRLFDVTDAYAPFEIGSATFAPGTGGYRLGFEVHETGARHYRLLPGANITRVPDASVFQAPATSRLNLRSRTRSADYLLIYYDGFVAAADSLATWRAGHLPLAGLSPPYEITSIPVSALYDQFSGGRTDPSAIRNFLRAAAYAWGKKPAFVTFLGDASYDFKNIKGLAPAGQPGSLVPSYENGFAIAKQFATDDWLLNVDDAALNIPDYFGGRIPAVDSRSAMDFVLKKVLFYERQAPTGTWRNKVLLIADDAEQGSAADPLLWKHLEQTSLLDAVHTPPHVDRAYVYLHTYPDGPGDTKPEAKAEIKQTINDGALMFNYIGHGSPFKLADETVLSDVDAGTFTNAQRPTLFVAASCDVGKFSDPTVQSLGERMVLAPGGGAVAVISATEIAYSNLNVALNWELYDQLFHRTPSGGQYHESIAEALFIAKMNTASDIDFNVTNNSKYQVMGDAATRLVLPRLWVRLSLHECGDCVPELTEVHKGTTVFFRGQVYEDSSATVPVALDGVADVVIEDSAPLDHAPDCPLTPGCNDPPIDYWFRAGPMFRGDVAVTAGTLQGSFVVPVEARGGARGRLRAYVQGRDPSLAFDTDGVGSIFTAVDTCDGCPPIDDAEGPRITLSFASGSTTVRPDAQLRVDLQDPSGILITGHTLQNGIVVTLDDNTTARVDITPSFRYQNGSHTTGTAYWNLPHLANGSHNIQISAADNLAAGLSAATHRSKSAINITVAESPPLQIVNAYLFPNPTGSGRGRSGGQFVVDALGDSVNALLRIYTVSGRLVRSLESFARQGQIQIPWDGLDHEGQALANGTYLFRVQLNVRDELGESSADRKAASEGRFVILNR
jgi:hypothetical protein